MALNDVLEIKHYFSCLNQVAVITRHYRVVVDGFGDADNARQLLCNEFDDTFGTVYRTMIASAATYAGTTLSRVAPFPRTAVKLAVTMAGVGALTGDLLPLQVSGLVGTKTALAGRAQRGRIYVPFPPESANDANSTPTASHVGLLDSLALACDDQVSVTLGAETISVNPVIYHRTTQTTDNIVAAAARDKWATQRRRGSFGQPNILPF